MSLIQQKYINSLSSRFVEPNTFIGGAGASLITSATDVLSYTSLSDVSQILGFQIDGNNNVSCYIESDFEIDSAMNSDEITWFLSEKLISSNPDNGIRGTNIEYLYAPNCDYFRHNVLLDSIVKAVNMEGLTAISFSRILESAPIKILRLPSVVTMGGSSSYRSFQFLSNLERLHLGALSGDNISETNWNKYASSICLGSGNTSAHFKGIGTGCKIYHNSDLGIADRNAFGASSGAFEVGDTITINGLVYTATDGATGIEGEFDASGTASSDENNLVAAINNDTRVGTLGTVSALRYGCVLLKTDVLGASGNTIGLSTTAAAVTLTPFQSGNEVHPFLEYMRDLEGCFLIERNNTILVSAPSNLTASNQTATSVDLNFTAPAANANGTDAYEVWVDDGTVYRKLFEYNEISASGDTLDLTEVVNDTNGNGMTGLKIKIRTIDGQMNYSPFSNEITLP